MSIYRTAVNNPVTTGLIFLAFAILGVFALMRLPVDNFPDVESNTIMVMSPHQAAGERPQRCIGPEESYLQFP